MFSCAAIAISARMITAAQNHRIAFLGGLAFGAGRRHDIDCPSGGGFEAVLICRDLFDRIGAGFWGVDLDHADCRRRVARHRLDAEVEVHFIAAPSLRGVLSF
jgi:hypothetical protein